MVKLNKWVLEVFVTNLCQHTLTICSVKHSSMVKLLNTLYIWIHQAKAPVLFFYCFYSPWYNTYFTVGRVRLTNVMVSHEFKPLSKAPVVCLNKKLYHHCLVLSTGMDSRKICISIIRWEHEFHTHSTTCIYIYLPIMSNSCWGPRHKRLQTLGWLIDVQTHVTVLLSNWTLNTL